MPRERLYEKKRSIMIGVKVTPEMRSKLDACALSKGMTLSTFILRVLEWYCYGIER